MKWWYDMMGYDRRRKPKKSAYRRDEGEYTVKEGDTPESIAAEFLDDPAAWTLITSYNGIGPEDIVPGRKIYFPRNAD